MKRLLIAICLVSALIFGCVEEKPIGGETDEHGCMLMAGYTWCEAKQKCLREWEEPCEGELTLEQAREIAQNSDCMLEGNLTIEKMYNDATNTWWFGMDIEKEGCDPACVVDENTESAQINWRCTGVIPPENE